MLISCDRHTPQDLEFWNEYVEIDKLHTIPKWKIDQAIESIQEFSNQPFYVSVSWGKDSIVALHLVLSLNLNPTVLHMTRGVADNPYTYMVRDQFLSRHLCDYKEVLGDYNVDINTNKINYKAAWKECCRIAKTTRYVSGIRANESLVRTIRKKKFGLISKNTCAPLSNWTSNDVFAYLIQNDLPVHPNYAMLGGGRWDRDILRVDRIGGAPGRGGRRDQWEKEYYSTELRKLIKLGDQII
ncbi:phosphoadenosine phosphosulfate reductase family protein [Leptospira noguchii]|uniref:Phosphoadenosine phosphosulfate reductase family protein n=1 Tax=Leptospira noguchii TaxID=28182 RepID=M6VLE2_9LEPT|nr:phosphoadenosine phosphosulfate reductase family protein [Leptospira noguchii]EMO53899.1 phosphoadenosine phosphosulfate reductase family protein [Leptospira noguchii]